MNQKSQGRRLEQQLLLLGTQLFWREGGDDFVEARVTTERIPVGVQTQVSVAQKTGHPCRDG